MDYLDTLIEKDRYETYRARKTILEDLMERTFKVLNSSTDPEEIKSEANKLVDYRLQLIDVNDYLKNNKNRSEEVALQSGFFVQHLCNTVKISMIF